MKLSIIILTWNSVDHIRNCINSIVYFTNEESMNYEIFIVDNGSTDGTVSVLNDLVLMYQKLINLILLPFNTGTTYSRNIALKQVRGDYVSIIDSDIILTSSCFGKMIEFFVGRPDVGLLAPRLMYANGKYQKSTDNFPTIISKIKRYFFLKYIERREEFEFGSKHAYAVDYAISAFWVIPANVVNKIGLFDENIFYAPEDADYCLRVWKNNLQVICMADISVIHNAQEISRGGKINKSFFRHLLGLFYFFKKHRYFLKRPIFYK